MNRLQTDLYEERVKLMNQRDSLIQRIDDLDTAIAALKAKEPKVLDGTVLAEAHTQQIVPHRPLLRRRVGRV